MATLYESFGGAEACRKLAAEFYARVPNDPVLRKVYGKSSHCAVGSLTAYLIQFLGGPPEYSKARPILSLREAHLRFRIGERERDTWLKTMRVVLDATVNDARIREGLQGFFEAMSARIVNQGEAPAVRSEVPHETIRQTWTAMNSIEEIVTAIRASDAPRAIALVHDAKRYFDHDRGALLSILALMAASGHVALIDYAKAALHRDRTLVNERYTYQRTLLHDAAGYGCAPLVLLLLELGADPNAEDQYGHRPLYFAGNSMHPCGDWTDVVQALAAAGADVNARDHIKQTTALHMAARRGNVEVAEALLDAGADPHAEDRSGDAALQRALNCRKIEVAALLLQRAGG